MSSNQERNPSPSVHWVVGLELGNVVPVPLPGSVVDVEKPDKPEHNGSAGVDYEYQADPGAELPHPVSAGHESETVILQDHELRQTCDDIGASKPVLGEIVVLLEDGVDHLVCHACEVNVAHQVHKLTNEEVPHDQAGEQILLLTGLVVLNQVERLVQRLEQGKPNHAAKEEPVEQDPPQGFVERYCPARELVDEYRLKNLLEEVDVHHDGSQLLGLAFLVQKDFVEVVLSKLLSLDVDEQVGVVLSEQPEDQGRAQVHDQLAKSNWDHVTMVQEVNRGAGPDVVEVPKCFVVDLQLLTVEVDVVLFRTEGGVAVF